MDCWMSFCADAYLTYKESILGLDRISKLCGISECRASVRLKRQGERVICARV
jgi:hypothetical protein